jgi:hypothetical protein
MIKLLISLIVFFISMIGFFRILRFYSPKVAKLKLLDQRKMIVVYYLLLYHVGTKKNVYQICLIL